MILVNLRNRETLNLNYNNFSECDTHSKSEVTASEFAELADRTYPTVCALSGRKEYFRRERRGTFNNKINKQNP